MCSNPVPGTFTSRHANASGRTRPYSPARRRNVPGGMLRLSDRTPACGRERSGLCAPRRKPQRKPAGRPVYHRARGISRSRPCRPQENLDIVGIYHSHPDHPAVPSRTDLELATFPGYTYIIVSIENGKATNLSAWSLAEDRSRFLPEQIDVQATQEKS